VNAKDSDFLSLLYQALVYGRNKILARTIIVHVLWASACYSEGTIGCLSCLEPSETSQMSR